MAAQLSPHLRTGLSGRHIGPVPKSGLIVKCSAGEFDITMTLCSRRAPLAKLRINQSSKEPEHFAEFVSGRFKNMRPAGLIDQRF